MRYSLTNNDMSPKYLCLLFFFVLLRSKLILSFTDRCDLERIRIDGDIILSSIVGFREPRNGQCGEYLPSEIQVAAAMVWTVNRLNGRTTGDSYIPGSKLGIEFADDCGVDRKAVKVALEALIDTGSPDVATCTAGSCSFEKSNSTVVGLIDTSVSQTVGRVAETFGSKKFPVIASSATAAALTNRSLYPSFYRTVPSDQEQMKVIIETVKRLNWTYIAVVYTSDTYGKEGLRLLKEIAAKEDNLCIMTELSVSSHERHPDRARDILTSLTTWLDRTRYYQLGVVYIGQLSQARLLMEIQQRGAKGKRYEDFRRLFWIMSEAVGTNKEIVPIGDSLFGGILTVALPVNQLTEFKSYFVEELLNVAQNTSTHPLAPLFKIYLESRYNCRLHTGAEKSCPDFDRTMLEKDYRQTDYVISAVDAVYVLATAVRNELCGEDVSSACRTATPCIHSFKNLEARVQSLTLDYSTIHETFVPYEFRLLRRKLRFNPSGEVITEGMGVSYELFNVWNGAHNRVGDFKRNKLSLATESIRFCDPDSSESLDTLPKSTCESLCLECIHEADIPFSYIPGDRLIVGLFSLSYKGQDEFHCGDFRSNTVSYPTFEAFNYAISAINKEYPGLNFGGIAFDDCYNPLRADYILVNFLSGRFKLRGYRTGASIDPDDVVLVIGPLSSDVTIEVADILTRLRIPQISYGSTSPDLDNREKYPYFLRTVPSDVSQVKGIVQLVEAMGWKYVAVVYMNNNYGTKGMRAFKELANQRGICVADPEIPLSNSMRKPGFKQIVSKLRQTFAKVVVYFGIDTLAQKLLDGLKTYANQGEFVFIATEAWGTNEHLLKDGRENFAKGSLVLHSNTPVLGISQHFGEFLQTKNPYSGERFNWLRLFWQDHFKCDLEDWFHGLGPGTPVCNRDEHSQFDLDTIAKFSRDQRVVHAINAVVAGASGIQSVLESICRRVSCSGNPRRIDGGVEMVIQEILNVSLPASTSHVRIFDQRGNGNIGFSIYNIQYSPERRGYKYVKVGQYENGKLQLDKEKLVFYEYSLSKDYTYVKSECDYVIKKCCRNQTVDEKQTREIKQTQLRVKTYREELIAIAAVAAIVLTAVVVSIVVFCICNRRWKDKRNTPAGGSPCQEVGQSGQINRAFSSSLPPTDLTDGLEGQDHEAMYYEIGRPRTPGPMPHTRSLKLPTEGTTPAHSAISTSNASSQSSLVGVRACNCSDPSPVERVPIRTGTVVLLCGRCRGIVSYLALGGLNVSSV